MPEISIALSLIVLGIGAVAIEDATAPSVGELRKDMLSVHRVRRGDMPIRLSPTGEIVSLAPPEVVVNVPRSTTPSPQIGRQASVQTKPPDVLIGSIVDIDGSTLLDSYKVTIRLKDPFPDDATIGQHVGSLIEVGELKDVVYLERPATARANATLPLFVVEPDQRFARRVMVRFGHESGALIEVISGLVPDDLVIVNDTSRWSSCERLRLK